MRGALQRIVIVACVLSGTLVGCERSETEQRQFSSLQEAIRAGATAANGYLPTFLPDSAQRIFYASNVDTNEAWVTFEFKPDDGAWFANECGAPVDFESLRLRAPRLPAWPLWLESSGLPQAQPADWRIGRCTDGGFAAVNSGAGLAAYWRTG